MLSISELTKRLCALNTESGGVYSTPDLEILLDCSHPSRLTETIRGLIREGVLLRVRRSLYVDCLNGYRPEIVGQRWLSPSYLSTETALDRHQLCQTGILTFTYVTTRLIARRQNASRTLETHTFIYRHLASHLFFGYRMEKGVLLADPEKAVLDFLYFGCKNQRSVLSPQDVDFARLNHEKYRQYLGFFRQRGFARFASDWLRGHGA